MNNPLGVYYAFLASSDAVDWIDCLHRTKDAGLDILECSVPKICLLDGSARRNIANHAKELSIGLTFATALTPQTDVSDPSPAIRRAGIRQLISDLNMASSMGALTLGGVVTGVSKRFPKGVEHTRGEMMERAAVSLSEVAKAAEDLHVNLGVEVVNRFESPLVNTCADGLKIAEYVNSPRVGVHLDTFHMNIEEANIGGAILQAGNRLIHFHACENNRALPGQAHIDWAEVFAALNEARYRGPIVMESLPGPYGSIAGRLNIWRRLSADVDGELHAAACFLKERMSEYGTV
ncbi:MAG: sugar phosphate isomerase/epimerase family protein [Bacillota bacterium]